MKALATITPLIGPVVTGELGANVLTVVARAMRILREARRTVLRASVQAGDVTWTWPAPEADKNDERMAFLAGFAGHFTVAVPRNDATAVAFRDGVAMRRANAREDDVIAECMRRWP